MSQREDHVVEIPVKVAPDLIGDLSILRMLPPQGIQDRAHRQRSPFVIPMGVQTMIEHFLLLIKRIFQIHVSHTGPLQLLHDAFQVPLLLYLPMIIGHILGIQRALIRSHREHKRAALIFHILLDQGQHPGRPVQLPFIHGGFSQIVIQRFRIKIIPVPPLDHTVIPGHAEDFSLYPGIRLDDLPAQRKMIRKIIPQLRQKLHIPGTVRHPRLRKRCLSRFLVHLPVPVKKHPQQRDPQQDKKQHAIDPKARLFLHLPLLIRT